MSTTTTTETLTETRPVGVEWSDDSYAYVDTCYGARGDSPGDCWVRVGQDERGLWWIDDGDGSYRELIERAYATEDDAREAAQARADAQHRGEPGEDAEMMRARLLDAAAGDPDRDGEWCVWWETVGDDSHAEERYATEDAARAACERAHRRLVAKNPGTTLLCGYTVRHLVDGEWVAVDEE